MDPAVRRIVRRHSDPSECSVFTRTIRARCRFHVRFEQVADYHRFLGRGAKPNIRFSSGCELRLSTRSGP